jgi:3-phosphoshikimate 1-carboxyvinyltransferase
VTVPAWPAHSTQPGHQLTEILSLLGGRVTRRGGAVTVTGGSVIHGVDLDLSAVSELTPTLVGLAAFADGPSSFTGIGHIRGHETDRLAALVQNLRAVGCGAEELPDGIRIVPQPMHGGEWGAFHDHRLATTGALVGLAVPNVIIDDIGTTAKTMPRFATMWQGMLGA